MKKWMVMLSGLLLFLFIFRADLSAAETETVKLYLDIAFKENMIFDKYDVDLYVDDQQVDTLKYAEPYSKLIEVSGDSHTITFYKASNHDYSGQEEITIAGDSTYQATIQTDSKKIKIITSEVEETLEGSSLEVSDVILRLLPEARENLTGQGFRKVTYKGTEGGKIKKESNWIVVSQNPSPGNLIDQNDEIELECQKITDFVSGTFMEHSVVEAIEAAAGVQYEISFINVLTGRDMRNEFAKLEAEELVKWKVTDTIPIESNKKVATLFVEYEGEANVPDVTGMSLEKAIEEMHYAGFSAVQGLSDKEKKIKDSNGDAWKVISQSETAGKKIGTDQEIILSCEAYKELSDISLFSIEYREDTGNIELETETESETEIATETELVTEKTTEKSTEKSDEPETEKESETEAGTVRGAQKEAETEGDTKAEGSDAAATMVVLASDVSSDMADNVGGRAVGAKPGMETELVASTEPPAEAPTEKQTEKSREKTTYTATANLNIRSLPSTEGTVLGKFNAYEQVSVYEIDDGWALIDYDGTDAYVSAQYIQKGTILPLTTPETNPPSDTSSTNRAVTQTEQQNQYQEPMVWISGSGSKYHSRSSCSNMNNPWQVPRSEAEAMGRTPCKKCY